MKMKYLGTMAACAAMVGVLALTGCGGTNSSAGSSQGSSSSGSSDDYSLISDGKLVVGTSADYEPFEYMEDGEFKGFDVELAAAIADKLGLEVQYESVDFDSILPGISSGTKYDVGVASITVTPAREKEVDFTDSYYMDDQAIVTMADDTSITADNYEDVLNDSATKIAVQSGSTAESFAKENFPNATIVPFKDATDCFAAVQSDQADAVVTNRSMAAQMVADAYTNEHVIKQISTGEEYAIAVSKDNPGLTKKINEALKELTDDGTIDELMAKYNIK